MFKVNNKDDVIDVVLVFLFLTLDIFHIFFSTFFIFDFEQVNFSWTVKTFCDPNVLNPSAPGIH